MEILILSCGTGGGHNSAAFAVQEEFLRRGCGVTLMNPFDLCGGKVAQRVDSAYIDLAQTAPKGFGAVYAIGNAYRRLPWRSPVYFANGLAAEALGAYLRGHPVDAIVMTHLYPARCPGGGWSGSWGSGCGDCSRRFPGSPAARSGCR